MTALLHFPWLLAGAISLGGALLTLGLLTVFARALNREGRRGGYVFEPGPTTVVERRQVDLWAEHGWEWDDAA